MSPTKYGRRAGVRRRRRIVGAVLVVLLLTTGIAIRHDLSNPSPLPVTSSTIAPTPASTSTLASTSAVGVISLRITEPASLGHPARTLNTNVRYPATGSPSGRVVVGAPPLRKEGPYPLIIFSQGFDIQPEAYAALLNAWTTAGYVVADPGYPFTSPTSPGGVVRTDIVHHPNDLSYVITSLLHDSAVGGGTLSGLINPKEIGAIGQSDGGDVTLASVASTCCRDPRIKVGIILSGAELSWFPGKYFATPPVPLLVVQGSKDFTMNPIACSVELYDQAPQPKYYLSMIGQTHLSAYVPPGPAQRIVERVTIDFLNGYLRSEQADRNALYAAGTVPGLATITSRASVGPNRGFCPGAPGS